MIVLKANITQYNELSGYTNGSSVLKFAEDNNGNWIVGLSVIKDVQFLGIRDKLNELERIEFEPKEINI